MRPISSNSTAPPKVLVTKIGLDGHDRGSRVVAAYLRDAGMEVVYTGPWQPIPAVVAIAQEEDVDVIGISSLSTDHLIVPKLMASLREAGLDHVGVVLGGIVPDEKLGLLSEAGVRQVFHPGATREEIVSAVRQLAAEARAGRRDFEPAERSPENEIR
jgi:methylmalonyl-CoA mutase C-terminal domain/subunit